MSMLFQGQFVTCRLGLAIINLHTKFEVSMFTHIEDMKGTVCVIVCLAILVEQQREGQTRIYAIMRSKIFFTHATLFSC